MFDSPYKFNSIGKDKNFVLLEHQVSCDLLTFRDINNNRYIVRVEEYDYNVFAIKFYLRNHRNSDNKYNLLTHSHKASRIISTMIRIIVVYFHKNPYSSFVFIGAHLIGEDRKNTKRFRVYTRAVKNMISPASFHHFEYPDESGYVLLNKDFNENNPDLLKNIEDIFNRIYVSSLEKDNEEEE